MKHILNLAAILSFSVAAFGQIVGPAPAPGSPDPVNVPLPPTPPGPKLPAPSSVTTAPDPTRYLNNPDLLLFCTQQVAEFNGRDADMIFIGDSITQNWKEAGRNVWEANFAPRNALDFGIGGDQIQHVLWRMNTYPIGRLHPKVAVVLIGTNNGRNTPQEIADGVKAVLDKTQSMFPGIKIILTSLMPNPRSYDRMMAANALLRTYADDKGIFYLDLVPLMPPVGDSYKGLGPDRLHPSAAGYQVWTDALLPLVNRFLPPPATAPHP